MTLDVPGANGAAALVHALSERRHTVATCESLTGGLVAAALTSVAGSSVVVRGGLVTYAADLKTTLAGVPTTTVEAGVVTEATALAMARGTRRACASTWGLATTGVAGPGPADGIAAGTVWIAVSGMPSPRDEVVATRLLRLDGDRAQVRAAVVAEVLALLSESLGV